MRSMKNLNNFQQCLVCKRVCCSGGSDQKSSCTTSLEHSNNNHIELNEHRSKNGNDQIAPLFLYSQTKRPRADNANIDLDWLLERFDFDVLFTCSILCIFKEQGGSHVASLLDAIVSENSEAISFHAVIY